MPHLSRRSRAPRGLLCTHWPILLRSDDCFLAVPPSAPRDVDGHTGRAGAGPKDALHPRSEF
eukprot:7116645-Pyramimonas_sp.AAC.1